MPRSGVSYSGELEVALAAQWWGYYLEHFEQLSGPEQARRIAVYRIAKQAESVIAADQQRQARRRQRGSGGGQP